MRAEVRCSDKPLIRRGRVIQRIKFASHGTDPFDQRWYRIEFGQIGGNHVRICTVADQILGECVKRFSATSDENDVVALLCIAPGDGVAETRTDTK